MMQYKTILRLLGLLFMLFSFSMIPPIIINAIFNENLWQPFALTFALIFGLGAVLWFNFRTHLGLLNIREGFFIVVLLWFCISLFASLPFILCQDLHQTLTEAIFETVSGITTTGASTFTHLHTLPHALLYYRQQLQFIGGMGIVVLAVAIFPMLGMGGIKLFRAEISGPLKDAKLTPRIAQTAKALWAIYCFITLCCALCYWYSGMDWFSAVAESFGTVSTGGFSIHDDSFLHYNSPAIEVFACIFMIIGSINFSLHYLAVQQHSFKHYWRDEEFRFYIIITAIAISTIILNLWMHQFFHSKEHTLTNSVFMIISMATTTGMTILPFDQWPTFTPILITFMSLIGGCAGSTTGGLKILRFMLIGKQIKREFVRLLHPQAVLTVKINQETVSETVLQAITGFTTLYVGLFALLILIFMAAGNDFITSFSAIAAGIANSGAGIGAVSLNFSHLNLASQWILILTMLIGRLEMFPLFILFTRPFWQK